MPALNLAEKTTAQLVEMYNDKAFMLDRPAVKRFADRATAEKRVAQIYGAEAGIAKASAPVTAPAVVEEAKAVVAPKETKPAKTPKAPKEDGPVVREGSFRDLLLAKFQATPGEQVSISDLMKAVYGKAQKDLKGPLMMVMKGLRGVCAANGLGEIRKTRENKENYFGLHKKN